MDAGDDRPCSPEAGDVFSLGATLYAMLVGDFPYPNKDFLQEDVCPKNSLISYCIILTKVLGLSFCSPKTLRTLSKTHSQHDRRRSLLSSSSRIHPQPPLVRLKTAIFLVERTFLMFFLSRVKGVRLCKLTYSADSAAFVASLPSPTATRCTFAHLRRNANPVEQPTEIKNNPIECIA